MNEREPDYSKSVSEFMDQRLPEYGRVPVLRFRQLPEAELEAVITSYSKISGEMLLKLLESPKNHLRVLDREAHEKINDLAKKFNLIEEGENLHPVVCIMAESYFVLHTKAGGPEWWLRSKSFNFGQALRSALILKDVPEYDFRRELQKAEDD